MLGWSCLRDRASCLNYSLAWFKANEYREQKPNGFSHIPFRHVRKSKSIPLLFFALIISALTESLVLLKARMSDAYLVGWEEV